MLLTTIAAESQYKEDVWNLLDNLLNTDEENQPPIGDENPEAPGTFPLAKRGSKMTQALCRRECASCVKMMNVLFMSCYRDCQMNNGRAASSLSPWSTCLRFLVG